MQGGRNRRDGFFDDPFGNFGGFGGGFGGHNGLFQSIFGGRDPFDDPFFRQPFGSMFGGNMLGPTIFNHSPFTRGMHAPGSFLEHEEAPPQAKRSRGPIIEEIVSEEDEEPAAASEARGKRKEVVNSNSEVRHGNGKREVVVHDNRKNEEIQGKSKQIQIHGSGSGYGVGDFASMQQQQHQQQQPRSQSFTFQSSTVTYGGVNGAYYTSSTNRRTGSDGIAFEERKEANSSTGQAAHRVSRAIHNKGHSLTRKLNSDGRVESNQTLHNLNQDEMGMFESAWGENAGRGLPGWSGAIDRGSDAGSSRNGWALPAPEQPRPQHDRDMHRSRGRRGGQSFQGAGGRI